MTDPMDLFNHAATPPSPALASGRSSLDLEAQQILARVAADLFGDEDTSTGRYVIRGKLGAGGMGVVYEAFDPLLDCAVALKQLHAHLVVEPGFLERLRAEARALARLRSEPHVVTLFDFFAQGGVVFVVMELVRGPTLRTWQTQSRSFTEVLEMYAQAGAGLAAAHRAGLVHRDFKPDNVLIDAHGVAKVSDFGLARDTHARRPTAPELGPEATLDRGHAAGMTEVGRVVGTPQYMAPEQLCGEPPEARSDQFSFCLALWEALFEEHPFVSAAALGVAEAPSEDLTRKLSASTPSRSVDTVAARYAEAIVHAPLRPVPTSSAVPRPIVTALARGLEKEPSARFATMEDLLTALRPRAARRRWIALGLVGAAGIATAALTLTASPSPAPPPGRAELIQAARADLVDALALEKLPALAPHVGPQLDRYVQRWSEQHAEQALVLQRRPGDPEATTRLRCLADARARVANTTRGLQTARPGDAHAVELVDALPSPEECTSLPLDWLACSQGIDALADVPAAVPVLAAMAEAERLEAGGEFVTAIRRATEATRGAGELGHSLLRGEAAFLQGHLLTLGGRSEEAIAALEAARAAVEPTGCADLRAKIYSRMIKVTALYPSLPAAPAEEWSRVHALLAAAAPDGGARLADAFNERALLRLLRLDDPRGATEDLARAIELRERIGGGGVRADLADSYLNLGIARHRLGDLDGAAAALDDATRIRGAVLGPEHPLHYKESLARADLQIDRGAWELAEVSLARAQSLAEAGFGEQSAPLVRILLTRIRLLEAVDALDGATAAAQKARVILRIAVEDPAERAEALAKVEALAARTGDAAALERLRALAKEAATDPRVGLESRAVVSQALAQASFNAEDFDAAREHAEHALTLLARAGLSAGSRWAQALKVRGLAGYFLAEARPSALEAAIDDLSLVLTGGTLSGSERDDVELTLAAARVLRGRAEDLALGCAALRELAGPRGLADRVGPELVNFCRTQ